MPSKTWIVTSTPLSKRDVKLASLIPDKRYPHMDALAKVELTPDEDYTNNKDKNFSGRVCLESNSFFKLAITRVFSANLEREELEAFHVTAKEGCIYELRKPTAIFQKLCELDEVKKWLQEGYVDKQRTYFVIGYRTLLDAKLVRQDNRSTEGSGTANLPIPDPTATGQVDVELTAGRTSKVDGEGEFETIGERIYAICYRKVGFKFHKGVGPHLKPGNIWKSFSKSRGRAPAEDEFVEVDINAEDESGIGEIVTFNTASGEERFVFLSSDAEDEGEDEEDEDEG